MVNFLIQVTGQVPSLKKVSTICSPFFNNVELDNTYEILNAHAKVGILNEEFNLAFIFSIKKKTLINKVNKLDNKHLSEVFKIYPSTFKFCVKK